MATLMDTLRGRRYYEPSDRGNEREIAERMRVWRRARGSDSGGA